MLVTLFVSSKVTLPQNNEVREFFSLSNPYGEIKSTSANSLFALLPESSGVFSAPVEGATNGRVQRGNGYNVYFSLYKFWIKDHSIISEFNHSQKYLYQATKCKEGYIYHLCEIII